MSIERHYYLPSRPATLLTLVVFAFVPNVIRGQAAPQTDSAKQQPAKPAKSDKRLKIRVSQEPILNISLKAEKIPLSQIADELSKQMKAPFFLGASMKKEEVSGEFNEVALEPALQTLAPHVYIDYEISMAPGVQPRPLGVFLNGNDDPAPAENVVVSSNSEAMLVEGNTEDGVEPKTDEEKRKLEDQPLRIVIEGSSLTLKAKKQPLAAVLLRIGSEFVIPVDLSQDSGEIVDVEFARATLEDGLRRLSPNILLFVRADLQTLTRVPLRIGLVEPPKPIRSSPSEKP